MHTSASRERHFTLRLSSDAHDLHWPPGADGSPTAASRGGLSGWQRKAVTAHIDNHLAEAVRLAELAALVRLSPYHFARAFKQSFGAPPHRYHVGRRIARAKDLLADPEYTITAIARELGFAETSSFSATFRRVTGASPSTFRRGRI
jgi:AraC family transcriptional regulator